MLGNNVLAMWDGNGMAMWDGNVGWQWDGNGMAMWDGNVETPCWRLSRGNDVGNGRVSGVETPTWRLYGEQWNGANGAME